jgi:hypothetical protein
MWPWAIGSPQRPSSRPHSHTSAGQDHDGPLALRGGQPPGAVGDQPAREQREPVAQHGPGDERRGGQQQEGVGPAGGRAGQEPAGLGRGVGGRGVRGGGPAAEQAAATAGRGLGLGGLRLRRRGGNRLLRRRWHLRRPFEQVGNLHAADEPRHRVDVPQSASEGAAGHPPPVRLHTAVPELVRGGEVRRRRRVPRSGRLGPSLGGARPRHGTAQPLRPLGVRGLRPALGLDRHGGGPRLGAGALGAARGRDHLVRSAQAVQDAAHRGGTVHRHPGPAPVDLIAQLRHQPHPRGRRQLPLLCDVSDAAQILVDDLVAFDTHGNSPPGTRTEIP